MSEAQTIRANVSAFLASKGVTFSASLVGETVRENNWKCDEWRITLTAPGKPTLTEPYYTGTGHRKQVRPMPSPAYRPRTIAYEEWAKTAFKPQAPEAADFLHSFLSDGEAVNMSFTDWCAEYGYDDDSIKALRTYEACCAIGAKLRQFFTRDDVEALREMVREL